MFGISRHPFQSVNDEFAQRTDILVFGVQYANLKRFLAYLRFGLPAPACTIENDPSMSPPAFFQPFPCRVPHLKSHQQTRDKPVFVEIGICNGHKEAIGNKPVDLWNLGSIFPNETVKCEIPLHRKSSRS